MLEDGVLGIIQQSVNFICKILIYCKLD